MPSVAHLPAIVYPSQVGANRVLIATWGVPTKVTSPGNSLGYTPPPVTDLDNTVINPSTEWAALATTDTCTPLFCPALINRSVHVTGTAGAGGSIAIKGSNDGTNYVTLHDVYGNALSALAPGSITQINESTSWIEAVVNSGDGTTAMNVILVGNRPF